MSIDERQELALELYRSRIASSTSSHPTGTIGRNKTYASTKKSSNPSSTLGRTPRSPPRPSPASVAYHSDEESLSKCYDENPDDSSVTEKPSEISSSESQVGSVIKLWKI
jgi:protein sidekick